MDTRYLQTFREVAKWNSFTRAAEVLGYAQSSVTTQIQNLETEFGVTLFERWGRKIRLTHAGEVLLEYSEQLLAILDETKAILSEQAELAGTLTVGTVESLAAFYLPPVSFLEERLVRSLQEQEDVEYLRVKRIEASLLPDSGLQERKLSIFPYANKYGLSLVDRLVESPFVHDGTHQIFYV